MAGGINRPVLPTTGTTPDEQRLRSGLGAIVRQFLDSGAFLARLLPGVQLRTVASGIPVALAWGSMNRVPTSDPIMLRLPNILPNMVGVPLEITKGSPTGIAFVSPAGKALDGVTDPTVDGSATGIQLTGAGVTTLKTDGTNWFSGRGGATAAASGGSATVASGVPSSAWKLSSNYSPIGLWQFNESLADSSPVGQPFFQTARGTARYTALFPGAMGIVAGGATGLILRMPHTGVATLLRRPGDISVQVIMQQTSETLSSAVSSSLLLGYRGAGGGLQNYNSLWGLFQASEGLPDWYTESGAGSGVSHFLQTPVYPPPAVRTVLFGVRRLSDVVQFFMDGKPMGAPSATLTTPDGSASGVMWIGESPGETPAPKMVITSLKITPNGMTDAEFLADYNASLGQYYGTRT